MTVRERQYQIELGVFCVLGALAVCIHALCKLLRPVPLFDGRAVVFGANLGGNITPIGSASTVVACTLLKKHGLKVGFIAFVKIGAVFAGVQLALASVYLLILARLL